MGLDQTFRPGEMGFFADSLRSEARGRRHLPTVEIWKVT